MADFPTTVHTPSNPTSANTLADGNHSLLHQSHGAEVAAVQTKVGTGSSTPSSGAVLVGTGSGTSAWDTSPVVTLDTPTLNTPDLNGTEIILDADADTSITADTDDQIDVKIAGADDFQFTANTFTVLAGSVLKLATSTSIVDNNGNELIKQAATGSAVNEVTVTNAATGNRPSISATGDDTNIGLTLATKGTGDLYVNSQNWSGSWTSYTPTLTNLSGGTITYAKYVQIGKTVHVRFKYTLAGAGVSGEPRLTLPVAAHADYNTGSITGEILASAALIDAATNYYPGVVMMYDNDEVAIRRVSSTPTFLAVSSTQPFTWGANDYIQCQFSYEAA